MMCRAYDATKRLIDIVGASVGLVVSAPVQLLVAFLVRVKLGSPVLFRQSRPGQGERLFELVKFRTMLHPDADGGLTADADRLTPLGIWLRSTSLDELPTLWNVLKGDMSLVGPRPLLPEYLHRYSPHQRSRHLVRPGLTGLAQISGRNNLTWEQKFDLDVQYVRERSLSLDFRILALTVGKVLRRDGIAHDANATMPEFRG